MRFRPDAEYYGVDGDPLLLTAMQRLVPGGSVHVVRADLRQAAWAKPYESAFDAVLSLTALHWLTAEDLLKLYALVHSLLKPGGTFVVGDPYLPDNQEDRQRLSAFQNARIALETGQTWADFWKTFYQQHR
jgi:SAM-dependent methyltransferase